MKVKCPKCNHVFDSIENPQPIEMRPVTTLTSACYNVDVEPSDLHISSYNTEESPTSLSFSDKITSYQTFTHAQKKGSDEILHSIKNHDGATWGQLEIDTRLSTATISKRLKEGKKLGIIKEDLKEGKKVYRI